MCVDKKEVILCVWVCSLYLTERNAKRLFRRKGCKNMISVNDNTELIVKICRVIKQVYCVSPTALMKRQISFLLSLLYIMNSKTKWRYDKLISHFFQIEEKYIIYLIYVIDFFVLVIYTPNMIYLFIYLSIHLSTFPSIHLSTYQCCREYVYFTLIVNLWEETFLHKLVMFLNILIYLEFKVLSILFF